MKITVNFSIFKREFEYLAPRKDKFSHEALKLIFDYEVFNEQQFRELVATEDYEKELDIISICREFNEFDFKQINEYYGISDNLEIEENMLTKEQVIEYLKECTIYIGETSENKLVYQGF